MTLPGEADEACMQLVSSMQMNGNMELQLGLIGTAVNPQQQLLEIGARMMGDAWIHNHRGLSLDGDGSYLTIPRSLSQVQRYATDGDFTIALWIHKPSIDTPEGVGAACGCTPSGCNTNDFEYIYSHQQHDSGEHVEPDDVQNANVNMMLSCQNGPTGPVSTAEGPIIRVNIMGACSNGRLGL